MSGVATPSAAGLTMLFRLLVHGLRDAALVEDDVLARHARRLAPTGAEERGEAVVVLLAPLLERMMMALRALQAHAEKELRHVLDLLRAFLHLAIPRDRRAGS